MRSLSVLVSTALLSAILLTGSAKAQEARYTDRAILAGRQQIRAEVDAAKDSAGHISLKDQYRILLDAKEVLRPEDLVGLERTLIRLTAAEEPAKTAPKVAFSDMAMPEPPSLPAGKPLAAPAGKAMEASPFTEEPPDVVEPIVVDEMPCGPRHWGRLGFGCPQDDMPQEGRKVNFDFASTVEGFKGPMDEGFNGNFGTGLELNAGMPVFQRLGIGFQAGSKVILSDFNGTELGSQRDQDFTSVGVFQRIPFREGSLDYGFTYDWLFDHYYENTNTILSQWRIKLAWEMNPWNELGGWATIRDRGDTNFIAAFGENFSFRPMDEGNFYWRHTWMNDVSLTGRLGFAQAPGAVILGADSRVPISPRLAITGTFTYITQRGVPADTGIPPGSQESWNVGVGLEFVPGGFHPCSLCPRFAPLLPVADNGTLAVRDIGVP